MELDSSLHSSLKRSSLVQLVIDKQVSSQVTTVLDAKVETVAHIKKTVHDVAVLVAGQVLQNFFVTVCIFSFRYLITKFFVALQMVALPIVIATCNGVRLFFTFFVEKELSGTTSY